MATLADTTLLPPLATAIASGLMAGLAVAVPMGPIGLLVVDRSVRHGRTVGLTAAAGVATVDLCYAFVAVLATTQAVSTMASMRRPLTFIGAAIIGVIGLRAIAVVGPRYRETSVRDPLPTTARPLRTYVSFVALTAINPATLLSFSALALSLGGRLSAESLRIVFAISAGAASIAWQATLAVVGSAFAGRISATVERRTHQLGGAILLGFAVLLLVRAS